MTDDVKPYTREELEIAAHSVPIAVGDLRAAGWDDPLVFLHRLLATARAGLEAATILREMYQDDLCSYDHHGYCQQHGWLTAGVCPHRRAQDLFAAVDGRTTRSGRRDGDSA